MNPWIRKYLCALLLAALTSCPAIGQTPDTVRIIHTSDCHLIFNEGDVDPVITSVRRFNKSDDDSNAAYSDHRDSLELFFRTVAKRFRADAVAITGDLVEFFEAGSTDNTFVTGQVELFRRVYDECPVPLFLTLGNHCITTYTVNEQGTGLMTSQRDAERARASWTRNIPCFYDGTYYEKIFSAGRTRYHCIFLDNGYESLGETGKIDKMQCDWLSGRLAQAGNDPVLLFFHVYFAVGDINGDGVCFKENGPVQWPTAKDCSAGLLKIINENRNVLALVVGHGHGNVFEKIHFPGGSDVYQIESGSVYDGLDNWRLFKLTEKGMLVTKPGGAGTEISITLSNEGE